MNELPQCSPTYAWKSPEPNTDLGLRIPQPTRHGYSLSVAPLHISGNYMDCVVLTVFIILIAAFSTFCRRADNSSIVTPSTEQLNIAPNVSRTTSWCLIVCCNSGIRIILIIFILYYIISYYMLYFYMNTTIYYDQVHGSKSRIFNLVSLDVINLTTIIIYISLLYTD